MYVLFSYLHILINFHVYKRVIHVKPWQVRADLIFNLNLAQTLLFNMCLTTVITITVPLYLGIFHKAD